jgi:putative ABC transport system substrate-binding protein
MIRAVEETAHTKELQLHVEKARTEAEINSAFATLVQLRMRALVVGNDTFLYGQREQIVALASRDGLPAIHGWREFVLAGGLISAMADTGSFVGQGKMLRGAVGCNTRRIRGCR